MVVLEKACTTAAPLPPNFSVNSFRKALHALKSAKDLRPALLNLHQRLIKHFSATPHAQQLIDTVWMGVGRTCVQSWAGLERDMSVLLGSKNDNVGSGASKAPFGEGDLKALFASIPSNK